MKRFVIILTWVCSFLSVHAADMASISAAFKSGNASLLTSSMDSQVDMAVPGSSKKCSGAEAVALLNTFFEANKPGGFAVVHSADKKDSGFLVGKLPAPKGEFRVNITYRLEGDRAIIQSIRIE